MKLLCLLNNLLYTCKLSCCYFSVNAFFRTCIPFIMKSCHEYTSSVPLSLKATYCFFFVFSPENSGLHVFDFLANSILKEVLSAIKKGKPGAFSPGRPTEFLINYKSSLDFLGQLEGSM